MAVLEALACGTPAVATDVNGHRSSVVDGTTGAVTDIGTPLELVRFPNPAGLRAAGRSARSSR